MREKAAEQREESRMRPQGRKEGKANEKSNGDGRKGKSLRQEHSSRVHEKESLEVRVHARRPSNKNESTNNQEMKGNEVRKKQTKADKKIASFSSAVFTPLQPPAFELPSVPAPLSCPQTPHLSPRINPSLRKANTSKNLSFGVQQR